MNVASQSSRGRSRSRSRSLSVRRYARRTSVVSVPRTLRYDGTCKFTRVVEGNYSVGPAIGWNIGASNYAEAIFTFSPTAMTLWGSNVNYIVANLPNAAEIAALWERVKIDKVEMTFTANITDNVATGTTPAYSAVNLLIANDINGPTSGSSTTDNMRQLATCKHYKLGGDQPVVKWTVRPKYQRLVQYTALSSSTEPATGFVASDTDIPHYGVRVGIPNTSVLGAGKITIEAKFFFTAKNVK